MIDKGQSSDPNLPNYDLNGIPLIAGSVEQILDIEDPLFRFDSTNYGHIKVLSNSFEGQNFYSNGNFWLPFQPFNFITPPFAGYVSGHSTFSRAAAEVLTLFTGDAFFPGGLGEYEIPDSTYLEAQIGPSAPLTLQWATYRDAANQSGLSRIWGGIHPPIDDIPGRKIGIKVGTSAFEKADQLFGNTLSNISELSEPSQVEVFPNPLRKGQKLTIRNLEHSIIDKVDIINAKGELVKTWHPQFSESHIQFGLNEYFGSGIYYVQVALSDGQKITKSIGLLK